jgi:hypothetical protein
MAFHGGVMQMLTMMPGYGAGNSQKSTASSSANSVNGDALSSSRSTTSSYVDDDEGESRMLNFAKTDAWSLGMAMFHLLHASTTMFPYATKQPEPIDPEPVQSVKNVNIDSTISSPLAGLPPKTPSKTPLASGLKTPLPPITPTTSTSASAQVSIFQSPNVDEAAASSSSSPSMPNPPPPAPLSAELPLSMATSLDEPLHPDSFPLQYSYALRETAAGLLHPDISQRWDVERAFRRLRRLTDSMCVQCGQHH